MRCCTAGDFDSSGPDAIRFRDVSGVEGRALRVYAGMLPLPLEQRHGVGWDAIMPSCALVLGRRCKGWTLDEIRERIYDAEFEDLCFFGSVGGTGIQHSL
mmetsp:Transcript_36243/g.40041  ORF Transcript_36243/g.40041 Transcript_36243/m.40041 type:complete len:100 (-) Transcript_36243:767-1066(-)